MVFNKIDNYSFDENQQENSSFEKLKMTWIGKINSPCIFVSSTQNINIDKLRNVLYKMVSEIYNVRYPFNNSFYF